MPTTPRRLVAKFYRDRTGAQPVDEYIAVLPPAHRLALDRQIERLNALDEAHPHLCHPYSSQIEGELRELRCHYGSALYRILYCRSEQFVVLLHIFRKNTGRVPDADKRIANDRWSDFRDRMNAFRRTLPSPVGRKAPRRRPA
jgi:phage-related protein